jgi:hypothetical protein
MESILNEYDMLCVFMYFTLTQRIKYSRVSKYWSYLFDNCWCQQKNIIIWDNINTTMIPYHYTECKYPPHCFWSIRDILPYSKNPLHLNGIETLLKSKCQNIKLLILKVNIVNNTKRLPIRNIKDICDKLISKGYFKNLEHYEIGKLLLNCNFLIGKDKIFNPNSNTNYQLNKTLYMPPLACSLKSSYIDLINIKILAFSPTSFQSNGTLLIISKYLPLITNLSVTCSSISINQLKTLKFLECLTWMEQTDSFSPSIEDNTCFCSVFSKRRWNSITEFFDNQGFRLNKLNISISPIPKELHTHSSRNCAHDYIDQICNIIKRCSNLIYLRIIYQNTMENIPCLNSGVFSHFWYKYIIEHLPPTLRHLFIPILFNQLVLKNLFKKCPNIKNIIVHGVPLQFTYFNAENYTIDKIDYSYKLSLACIHNYCSKHIKTIYIGVDINYETEGDEIFWNWLKCNKISSNYIIHEWKQNTFIGTSN